MTDAPSTARGCFWSVFRWLPFVGLCLVATATLGLVVAGGLPRVAGWTVLLFALPYLTAGTLIPLLLYAVIRRRHSAPIVLTGVLALVCVYPGLWPLGIGGMVYPAPDDAESLALDARLPTDAPMRVFWGGDTLDQNYHALYPDQRFAFDLTVDPTAVGSETLADYGCYGIPVLAPVDGEVVIAEDGHPDATPGPPPDTLNALGNHVALRTAQDTFLLLAHLQPGSLAVEVGQSVSEGERLGACGNSGRTSEPHIHVHHQRQDPREFPLGFAEGLPLRYRDHDGPPVPTGGARGEEGEAVELLGPVVRHLGAGADL